MKLIDYAVLLCYTDGNVGYMARGVSVEAVTIGVMMNLVDRGRELLAVGVKVHVPN